MQNQKHKVLMNIYSETRKSLVSFSGSLRCIVRLFENFLFKVATDCCKLSTAFASSCKFWYIVFILISLQVISDFPFDIFFDSLIGWEDV